MRLRATAKRDKGSVCNMDQMVDLIVEVVLMNNCHNDAYHHSYRDDNRAVSILVVCSSD